MTNEFKNKIKGLELETFTCFEKADFEFCTGINVFIGENGTGKTHILKVLHASLKNKIKPKQELHVIRQDLAANAVFSPYFSKRGIDQLIHNGPSEIKRTTVQFFYDDYANSYILTPSLSDDSLSKNQVKDLLQHTNYGDNKGIFIPSQELMSWSKDLISFAKKYDTSIEKTYLEFAELLFLGIKLRPEFLKKVEPLFQQLTTAINAEIQLEDDTFWYYPLNSGGGVEATMTGQGINKLGQLVWLLTTGAIDKNSIIFWDEPENNLNPKYLLTVVQLLKTLANWGCQIFVATHNYLLAYELSQIAEYHEIIEDSPPIKFFGFYKEAQKVTVSTGKTMMDLPKDPIMDAYAIHDQKESELEVKIFQKSQK